MSRAAAARHAPFRYPVPQHHGSERPGAALRVPGTWSASEVAARPYRTDEAARQADGVAVSLAAALARLTPALAKVAAALTGTNTVEVFGFARLNDYARERLGRSGRWVKDLARLHACFARLPALRGAVNGEDGGPPLHASAALAVGGVAADSDVDAWIALARRVTLTELRLVIRSGGGPHAGETGDVPGDSGPAASCENAGPRETGAGENEAAASGDAASGSEGSGSDASGNSGDVSVKTGDDASADPGEDASVNPGENASTVQKLAPGAATGAGAADEADDELSELRLRVPPAVRAAFRETLDLYRAVEGSEASVCGFVEALVAEASTEPSPGGGDRYGEAHVGLLRHAAERDVVERALARAADDWKHLPDARTASGPAWAVRLAGSSLARLRRIELRAGDGGPAALDAQMRELMALENELELRVGEVLRDMAEMGAWRRLGFAGTGHYAERRLGISRTAAEDRVWVARVIRSHALVRMAYERGELGWEATRHILRLFKGRPADEARQREWIARGRAATVKRLGDEVKALQREAALAAPLGNQVKSALAGSDPSTRDAGVLTSASGAACSTGMSADGVPPPMTDEAWHASLRREPGSTRRWMGRLGKALELEAEAQTAPGRMDEELMRLRLPGDLARDFLQAVGDRCLRLRRQVLEAPNDQGSPEPEAPASEPVTPKPEAPGSTQVPPVAEAPGSTQVPPVAEAPASVLVTPEPEAPASLLVPPEPDAQAS